MLVDHSLEDGLSGIFAVVFRAYELAAQVGRELLHERFVEGLAHGPSPIALLTHHNCLPFPTLLQRLHYAMATITVHSPTGS